MSSLSIVVPIYNESRTIETLVAEIRKLPTNVVKETIFVNDGSTDDSEEKLKLALSLKPMRHILISKKNGGKASAVIEGLKRANTTHVVILDADLELDVSAIPELWQPVVDGESDSVFGYREFRAHSSYTYRYVMGNKLISHLYGMLFNQFITDIMCGFKIFPRELIHYIPKNLKGFSIEVGVPVALWKIRQKPKEISVKYHPRSRHEGKIINHFDAFRVIGTLVKLRIVTRRQIT